MENDWARKLYEDTGARCGSCRSCALSETRTNPIWGRGDPSAKLFVIASHPISADDKKGLPFSGDRARELAKLAKGVNLDPEHDAWLTYLVRCLPPAGRAPLPGEELECSKWLLFQIKVVRPRILVILGPEVLRWLTGVDDFERLRGTWLRWRGMDVMPTWGLDDLTETRREQARQDWLLVTSKRWTQGGAIWTGRGSR